MTYLSEIWVEGFGYMFVTVIQDGNYWWAEGKEWDYHTQGDSVREALWNFKRGFECTIEINTPT